MHAHARHACSRAHAHSCKPRWFPAHHKLVVCSEWSCLSSSMPACFPPYHLHLASYLLLCKHTVAAMAARSAFASGEVMTCPSNFIGVYGVRMGFWAAQSSSSSSARYINGVSFQEAYRQLLELQAEPDFMERKFAAGKLMMQHILTVRRCSAPLMGLCNSVKPP